MSRSCQFIVAALLSSALVPVAALAATPPSKEPPVIPVGYDAYRMWDKWAYLRIGQRTYMRSTYDRTGGNEGADASHFLYQLADDRNVTLDVTGPGELVFARYNHWHGSPWHYVVDGQDNVVQETSSATPDKPVKDSVFLPQAAFPNPLTWTWSQTQGADLSWVPVPFEKSFAMAYERTHYGTGYYIYRKFAPGAKNLSQPIKSWTPQEVPPQNVLDLLRPGFAGFHKLRWPPGKPGDRLTSRGRLTVIEQDGPGTLCEFAFAVPVGSAKAFGEARLRIYWDGAAEPSVDAPVKLFFGTGSFHNRDNREFLVDAFPLKVFFEKERLGLHCRFPMSFSKSIRMEIEETQGAEIDVLWGAVMNKSAPAPGTFGYFHATYVDHGTPEPGKDLVFLDTTKVEGGGDWCGHFVGTSFIFSDRAVLTTLEGDPRFYFDDSQTPQAQGTGTEEWGGGGDYWGGKTMTLPFAGHPVGCPKPEEAKNDEDKIQSAYRFLLADLMPFGRNARITFEHGGQNDSTEHYQSVTYWYGLHQPCLKLTDEFHVGHIGEETRHQYDSPTASDVQPLNSRYEWGVDHVKDQEIFPESHDTGRYMNGISTFRMVLDPANIGMMLRRKFDYSFANQCAKISVADDNPDAPWHEVGLWYTAGSNTCVYSNPKAELGATQHIVQTSNRRWREDEFLLPRELTEGRSAIRIQVEFVPVNTPLYPGQSVSDQVWSEYRYWAYCYVMPGVN